jgi:CBS domain-containing protein
LNKALSSSHSWRIIGSRDSLHKTQRYRGELLMTIAAILARKGAEVYAVPPEMSIYDAARTLRQHRVGAVLVLAPDGHVLGVLSERDIVRALVESGQQVLEQPLQTIMTSTVHTCAPKDTVGQAMAQMTTRRIRHLPVLHDGKLVGMVSIGDLVKARIEESEQEAAALKEYISAA